MLDPYKGERNDTWETPESLFKLVRREYFVTCDLATSKRNNLKTFAYYTKEKSSLKDKWPCGDQGVCWLNPPFSKAEKFFKKAKFETMTFPRPPTKLIAIYKTTNLETKIWQDEILPFCDWVHFLKGRTQFVLKGERIVKNGKVSSVPFGCALIGWNVPAPKKIPGVTWIKGLTFE